MTNDPIIEFAVIRSLKQGRGQYVSTWSLRTVLLCLTHLLDDAHRGTPSRLNRGAASKLAEEWTKRNEIPGISPIVVTIRSGQIFTPHPEAFETGIGTLRMTLGSIVDVPDGIHRIEALWQLKASRKELLENTWPIHLIETSSDHEKERLDQGYGQLRNSPGRSGSKSSRLSFGLTAWTARAISGSRFLQRAVALGRSSLASRSPQLWPESAIRNALRPILASEDIVPDTSHAKQLSQSWDDVCLAIPQLHSFFDGGISASNLRASTVLASASTVHVLAQLCSRILRMDQALAPAVLETLAKLDWTRDTGDFAFVSPKSEQKDRWTALLLGRCRLPANDPCISISISR